MGYYVTQRGVTVQTSAANAAAMGYTPAEGSKSTTPNRAEAMSRSAKKKRARDDAPTARDDE